MLRVLGHYRVLERIGAGGMGEVYRAHDDRLDRDVALKLLPAERFADVAGRARLLREARSAAALNHPGICTIHDVGEADGQAYIAMELIDGTPIDRMLAAGSVSVDDAVRIALQIAEALEHAHAHGVIHRDLKSANVIVTRERRVKVLDFGLAKRTVFAASSDDAATAARDPASLTEAGSIVGTIAYMAPEQLRGHPADARSDVWALGVTLHEMVAGARPFGGASSFETSSRILSEPPAPCPSHVPAALRAVIGKCLEKDPARRYQTARDVADALRSPTGAAVRGEARSSRGLRRPLGYAAAIGLAASLLALGLKWGRTRIAAPASHIETLAVLPLSNLSGDPGQEFLADGFTELLSTDLARLRGLKRVIGRGSVIRYKGTTKPLEEIARELHVDALVTGSVIRAGNRLAVTAQLLDPATGAQLWTNRYERDLQDVLLIRDEIISGIVQELRTQLTPEERTRLASTRAVNPQAFEAYVQGRFHWYRQTREDYDLAERYFQLALDRDPTYAPGLAGLGLVWEMRADAGFMPPSEALPRAQDYFKRALELDDGLADVLYAVGTFKAIEWDWTGAEANYSRALAAQPNHADARFFRADLLLCQLRRPDEWKVEIQHALDLDPLNEFKRTYYGWHLNYLKRWDEAIPVFQQLLPTGPNKAANYLGLWGAYHRKGRYSDALEAAREYFKAAGDAEFAATLTEGGSAEAYRASMRSTAEAMAGRAAERHVPAARVARMFAHAGDADRAMEWLEKAYTNRESTLARLGVFWDWLDLHDDPRFKDLLRRLNLPAA